MKHKLMRAMAAREAQKPKLEGRVEIDDAYLGGERPGGKRGRGAAGKQPFVAAVEKAGCSHRPIATGSGKQAARWTPLRWVNTTLGNIKTALAGTYHHVSAKHAQAYLTSFAYRFNRRRQLDSIVERLAWAAVHTGPQPYRVITVDAS